VSVDEQHIALPKLYGAPAYARPPAAVATAPRPIDPDDLPITAFQTEEDRAILEGLPARPYNPGGGDYTDGTSARHPRARPLSLRAIAGRLLGG
jgi:hypothetical protein